MRVPIRRRFSTWAIVGALVLVLIAAVTLHATRPAPGRRPLLTPEGRSAHVMDMAFSLDAVFLASASIDGSVRVWRAHDGIPLRALEHAGVRQVLSVAFSPDGESLELSEPDEGHIQLTKELLDSAREHY